MDNHLVPGGEGLAAELAAVGAVIGVNALVLAQQVAALEVLRTVRALEGSLVGVDATNVKKKFPLPGVSKRNILIEAMWGMILSK